MKNFKSGNLLHNVGKYENSNEMYTPSHAVQPILKYIPEGSTIWAPFDTEDSHFVKMIRAAGHRVVHSHIDDGQDFFDYEPDEPWDLLISNPPYKGKRLFFERALSLNKPFAFLMTLACFNDKYPAWSFKEAEKTMQLLKFDKRIKFENPDGRPNNKITFQSGYMCSDFLPNDMILEELPA